MEYKNIELDFCSNCLGIWLDAEELQWILEAEFDEHTIFTKSNAKETKKKCPRCRTNMNKFSLFQDETILCDTCPNNHGFWFDRGELEILIQTLPKFSGTHSFLHWLTDVFQYPHEK